MGGQRSGVGVVGKYRSNVWLNVDNSQNLLVKLLRLETCNEIDGGKEYSRKIC